MAEAFLEHIRKFTELTDADFESVLSYFEPISVKKKQNLITEGEVCRCHYFVVKGCLRKFFITNKGAEQTTEFALETWWITDNIAYERQQVTNFYIQAVGKSEVLAITYEKQ